MVVVVVLCGVGWLLWQQCRGHEVDSIPTVVMSLGAASIGGTRMKCNEGGKTPKGHDPIGPLS